MTEIDIDHLKGWIGRSQERHDTIGPRLVESFDAIFDATDDLTPGAVAPTGIHWCLAPDIAPMRSLGADGHPARGGFLPPVPFPRRMWAGGELRFHGDFRLGDEVARISTIEDVALKLGRSGRLVFVTVRHAYRVEGRLVLDERQDIVYRDTDSAKPAPAPAPHAAEPDAWPDADRTVLIDATPTLLFRYSALTFNGHRIHYDLDYVTRVEGYPGLVFHGPLQATYLLRLAAEQSGAVPARFTFRSTRPLFAGGQISLQARREGEALSLRVRAQHGQATMVASVL